MVPRAESAAPRYGRVLRRPACRAGVFLGEPYTKQLAGKLRELRFHLDGDAMRITYWIGSGRRIILLTAFRKQRMWEPVEIQRALRAMRTCIAEEHTADEG
ncbi:type II toxin-antitoxin system RelE/ParE family toxin [Streptomyces sp. WMMC940]|uniref:type II toxin-antitoxin system RelE/ParE family toxin n=1 Tax=Streptomyces sp. WMMC940 TaxID=3015153 RepID=UPI0022B6ABF4|nr:type II toxin-antitoxin system RelE/ParE family toxin [Streptomyces sp. WMMC940]MCZ7459632.1 type II toxin-antitoxin system RelE/ParE family toxin [Streptomyces sp. WMMC940]